MLFPRPAYPAHPVHTWLTFRFPEFGGTPGFRHRLLNPVPLRGRGESDASTSTGCNLPRPHNRHLHSIVFLHQIVTPVTGVLLLSGNLWNTPRSTLLSPRTYYSNECLRGHTWIIHPVYQSIALSHCSSHLRAPCSFLWHRLSI